jgi:glycosyltransferase involved in cell wall biosynthesis
MRIGISIRGITEGSYAVSELIQQITDNLLEIGKEHTFFLYSNHASSFESFSDRATIRVCKQRNRLIFDQLWLPWILKRDQVDFAIFFKGTLPLLSSTKSAVMILDLGYYYPELNAYKFLETRYMKIMLRLSAAKARIIFSISQYTKDDIVRLFGTDPNKIHVTHLAVPPIFSSEFDQEKFAVLKAKYHLPDKFIFFPTNLSPRKNLIRTIHAFNQASNKIPHVLYITGGHAWNSTEIEKLIYQFPEKIIKLGEIPAEDFPLLYSLADFAIYPSLFEGFGVPILEAFSRGCPVLSSNVTSIPEVAGDAALLVDPYSVASIADGIIELAFNEDLRISLKNKGYQRAKFFSYRQTAKVILEAIENNNL